MKRRHSRSTFPEEGCKAWVLAKTKPVMSDKRLGQILSLECIKGREAFQKEKKEMN